MFEDQDADRKDRDAEQNSAYARSPTIRSRSICACNTREQDRRKSRLIKGLIGLSRKKRTRS
jgi:hypothetical protein